MTITPTTSVQPVPAAPSSGWEIKVPFQIDPATGGVAVLTQQLDVINQHIITIIFTLLGERLMLPTFGSSISAQVFEPNNSILAAFLVDDLKKAITAWEPSVKVQSITSSPSTTNLTGINLAVSYTVVPFNNLNSVSVNVGGSVNQVISI